MTEACCIILAGGDGSRMKSNKPKALTDVLFEPMLSWVLSAVKKSGINKTGVIIGSGAQYVTEYLAQRAQKDGEYKTFTQSERLGTAHALLQGLPMFSDSSGDVLVLCADAPFIDEKTIVKAYKSHKENDNDVTVITAKINNPSGYGRIIRNGGGISEIKEHKECSEAELEIKEVNSGAYWFKCKTVAEILPKIKNDNTAGEYYLTDSVSLIHGEGKKAGAYTAENPMIVNGANSRRDLLKLNEEIRIEIINTHMDNGVEFLTTSGIIIGKDVIIGKDTVILPGTILKGKTKIGEGCTIGPNTYLEDVRVGSGTALNTVQGRLCKIGNNTAIGPYANIRPDCVIGSGVRIGDFVELKNAEIGENTSISHLTYLGDCTVGKGCNFGCGCVTANYDGMKKHHVTIGDGAFIGCNTNLVSPVNIGNGAYTAAGSTITKDVPDYALAIERGDQHIKKEWAKGKYKGQS